MRIVNILFAVLCFSFSANGQKAGHNDPKPNNIVLKAGYSEMVINQDYGGRIISLKYIDKNLITGPEVHDENFGSTLWTDPQSTWGWPPYETLDIKPYKAVLRKKEWRLFSGEDIKSGFQMSKFFKVSEKDSGFIITYRIKNISNINKSVGAWEVTRVFPGGLSLFPAAPDSSIMAASNLPGVSLKNGIIWFSYDFDKIKSHSKLFAMGSQGWFAHIVDNIVFIKSFEDIASAEIAREHGEIEIYADGDQKYTELENHGRHVLLAPGKTLNYQVKWFLREIPSNIHITEGSIQLVNFIERQINR